MSGMDIAADTVEFETMEHEEEEVLQATFCIHKDVAIKLVPESEDVLCILEVDVGSGEGIGAKAVTTNTNNNNEELLKALFPW